MDCNIYCQILQTISLQICQRIANVKTQQKISYATRRLFSTASFFQSLGAIGVTDPQCGHVRASLAIGYPQCWQQILFSGIIPPERNYIHFVKSTSKEAFLRTCKALSGTSPSTDSPDARRRRISVELTSSGSAEMTTSGL